MTINNSQFIGNNATSGTDNHGGAIYQSGGTLTISQGLFDDNGGHGRGGGIYSDGTLNLANTTLSDQWTSQDGGAIYSLMPLDISMGTRFGGNWSGSDGGAVHAAALMTVDNSHFVVNSATNGAGIYSTSTVNLSNVIFDENSVTQHGGAVYSAGDLTVTSTRFTENWAAEDGGAIYNENMLNVNQSAIHSNHVGDSGGGIYSRHNSNSAIIRDSCIDLNTAVRFTGIASETAGFDASSNWWGSVNGPQADQINGNVVSGNDLSTCPNSVPTALGTTTMSLALTSAESTTTGLDILQLPVALELQGLSDETNWLSTGTWDLARLSTRSNWTWVVDARPRQHESILEPLFLFDLGNRPRAQLQFQQKVDLAATDTFTIEVLAEGSTEWVVLDSQSAVNQDWQLRTLNLSAYRGQIIRIRVRLQTGDEPTSSERSIGVWLDDFTINYGSN